jgi:hypothetical protein
MKSLSERGRSSVYVPPDVQMQNVMAPTTEAFKCLPLLQQYSPEMLSFGYGYL